MKPALRSLAVISALFVVAADLSSQALPLRIVVVEGEDAVNVIQQKTAVAPVIEVRDRNGVPVAGVACVFTVQGNAAAFGSGLKTVTVITDSLGRATSGALSPLTRGSVKIQVSARFQGQTLNATISQANVATTAELPKPDGGSNLTRNLLLTTGAAGVAAGAYFGGGLLKNNPPEIFGAGVRGNQGRNYQGLVDIDEFTFTVDVADNEGDPLTYKWEFGDGSTATTAEASHVYRNEGDFNVFVTVNDGKVDSVRYPVSPFSIAIRTLRGRWQVDGTSDFFEFATNGTSVTGSYTVPGTGRMGSLSGTLGVSSVSTLQFSINLTLNPGAPAAPGQFVANPDAAFWEGKLRFLQISGGGFASRGYTLTRQ